MAKPRFGPGEAGVIWFGMRRHEHNCRIGLSYFACHVHGVALHPAMKSWLRKLRRTYSGMGEKIGRVDEDDPEVLCLPGAKGKIDRGWARDLNP